MKKLIRDRVVVGADDDQLRDKLQSEPALTLGNTVQISRRYETAKQAKAVARYYYRLGTVESVGSRHSKPKPESSQNKPTPNFVSKKPKCSRCGSFNTHNKSDCLASKLKCKKL